VTLEDPALAATALDSRAEGMDFADALHLAKAEGCTAFVSFDQRYAKAAKRLSQMEVQHAERLTTHLSQTA
jgi:predicted nucleic acid-binding protein